MSELLEALQDAAEIDGPDRAVIALSQSQVREVLGLIGGLHMCGHRRIEPGCGGCDPAATEDHRDDEGRSGARDGSGA